MTELEYYGVKNPDVTTLSFTNEEDWLTLRTKGIGGSDIGAVMGLNKYKSPLQVYKEKVEDYKVDLSDNANVKKGKVLEELILTQYVQPYFGKMGYMVQKPEFMMINSNYPYFRANVDGIGKNLTGVGDDHIIIEIKWVSEYAEVNWNGSEYCGVPASYYAQVQLYMLVTGAQKAYICALFDKNWEMHYYMIPRDELFIAKMKTLGEKFYNINMTMHIPPRIDVVLDKEDAVEAIKTLPKPTIDDDEMTKAVEKYIEVNAKIKELESYKSKINSLILEMALEGKRPSDHSHSVKMSVVTSKRFNSTRFKEEQPILYEQYCENSSSSRTTIK